MDTCGAASGCPCAIGRGVKGAREPRCWQDIPVPGVDDECRHGLAAGTCSICSGRDRTADQSSHARGTPQVLDSPAAVERYRDRYPGDREATFDAYVDVFFRFSQARDFPGGWTHFSRCANAEPALVSGEKELVRRAEELMRLGGYEADDSARPTKGRRWVKASRPRRT